MDWHVFITVLLLTATSVDFILAEADRDKTTASTTASTGAKTASTATAATTTATTTITSPPVSKSTTVIPTTTILSSAQSSETTADTETSATSSSYDTRTSPGPSGATAELSDDSSSTVTTPMGSSLGSSVSSSTPNTDGSITIATLTSNANTITPPSPTTSIYPTSPTSPNTNMIETITVQQTSTSLGTPSTSLTSTTSADLMSPSTTKASSTETPSQPGPTSGATTSNSNMSMAVTSEPTTNAPITSTTPMPATTPDVKIGETNILLAMPKHGTLFVELNGTASVSLDGLWLVIHDAGKNTSEDHLLKLSLTGSSLSDQGRYVVKQSDQLDLASKLKDVESVLIALFTDEDSADQLSTNATKLMDALLYSSSGVIDVGLTEKFSNIFPYSLVINQQPLQSVGDISLSRCSNDQFGTAFVLTTPTMDEENNCTLNTSQPLQMKLMRKENSCVPLSPGFSNSLADAVITVVNKEKQCGLSRLMFEGMIINLYCVSNSGEVEVSFTVNSAFQEQLDLVVGGINQLVESKTEVKLQSETFTVMNCSSRCFPKHTTPKPSDDDKIHVTVAVVVSCIGIFLIVLLIVFIYMRRKKRGILQFRMTRLDEDDDDLIGDMDDFVGNQGPTFRSYR